jgi:histidinol-phosphate aminotransferase
MRILSFNSILDILQLIDDTVGLELYRHPDPPHPKIKDSIAKLCGLPFPGHVFVEVGSGEFIGLLMHVCFAPGSFSDSPSL